MHSVESEGKVFGHSNDFGSAGNFARPGKGMPIQSDRLIRKQATKNRMIEPFSEKVVRKGFVSRGLSPLGCGLQVPGEFKLSTNAKSAIIDPKVLDEQSFVSVQAEPVIVPPLRSPWRGSLNAFKSPGLYLRSALENRPMRVAESQVNGTPFEPEWEGFATVEVSNATPLPAKV